jgi:L-ascorbate metabolism protein UlaG (beta-lactamase superfamily)
MAIYLTNWKIPPTNGWMLELGTGTPKTAEFSCGYRIYISGDTLMVDELHEIPKRYAGQQIDLMLAHLGGTTIPSPLVGRLMEPLALMVTMDAEQGLQLIQLIQPDITIPIHYDDYDVFASPLEDFKRMVEGAGLSDKVVILDRSDQYRFRVRG